MKVERLGPSVFLVTNDTDMDALVVHGDEDDGPQSRDVLKPGESWEFRAPLEVRFGPFLSENPDQKKPKVVVISDPSSSTMLKAMRRGWQAMERKASGAPMTIEDFNVGVIEFFQTLGGQTDDTPFKPALVPKDEG